MIDTCSYIAYFIVNKALYICIQKVVLKITNKILMVFPLKPVQLHFQNLKISTTLCFHY